MMSSDVMAADYESMRTFSTAFSLFAIPNVWQSFDGSSATGSSKEMAGSARGVNGQG